MGSITVRIRSVVWFVTGAVLATSVMLMFANAWSVDASPGEDDSTFVPITPCRLADTRPGDSRVGESGTLTADDTTTFQAIGSNGECTIATDAVGLSLNVTALGATSAGNFLTVWPGGERPLAASLNPAPGEPPTPNAVTTPLSDLGSFNVYNFVGSVNVVIDVVGYYTKSSLEELAARLASVESRLTANEAVTDRLDAAQPFAVVSETAEFGFRSIGSTSTAVASISITAPVDGRVSTVASGSFLESTSGEYITCGLSDEEAVPPGAERLFWQAPNGSDSSHLSASRVFDIAAGATETYFLMCDTTDSGTSSIVVPRLIGIFTAGN